MLIDCVLHIVYLYILYRTALCKKIPLNPQYNPTPIKLACDLGYIS